MPSPDKIEDFVHLSHRERQGGLRPQAMCEAHFIFLAEECFIKKKARLRVLFLELVT